MYYHILSIKFDIIIIIGSSENIIISWNIFWIMSNNFWM